MRHADILSAHLARRILILDGGMGTELLRALDSMAPAADTTLAGVTPPIAGSLEWLTLTHPALVCGVHESYLAAGADIISTNTFCGDARSQTPHARGDRTYELNYAAAGLARTAADAWTARTADRPRFVAGIIGPSLRAADRGAAAVRAASDSPVPASDPADGAAVYLRQVAGLVDGGVDLLLVETIVELADARDALTAIRTVFDTRGTTCPVSVSTLPARAARRDRWVAELWEACTAALGFAPFSVGFNCGDRSELASLLPQLEGTGAVISCHPSAGLPAADGVYPASPAAFAAVLGGLALAHGVNVLGGCCGTTPAHIRALATAVEGVRPRGRHS